MKVKIFFGVDFTTAGHGKGAKKDFFGNFAKISHAIISHFFATLQDQKEEEQKVERDGEN